MRAFIEALDSTGIRINQNQQTKKILQFLLQEGGKTIPEIRDFSRLSLPTSTKLVAELLEQNILIESGKRESSGGRPPSLYSLNPEMGYIVGVELLLKSFRMSIINLNHEVIYEYETDSFDISNREESYQFLVTTVPNIIERRGISQDTILGVGIGITGRVDKRQGISHSYLNYEKPLVTLLSEQWNFPVFIDNDTHLMALGEQSFGLAKEEANVLYLNLSRGLGLGFISNGIIHNGKSGFSGEFGHIHFENNEKKCVCGKKGCLETVVSGIALENLYQEATKNKKELVRYKNILQLVRSGDPLASNLLSTMSEKLGQALSILVQVLNPSIIILGGRFAQVGEFMRYPMARGLSLYGLPQLVSDCEIKISTLGEKTTMLGAYAMVIENVFR